MTYRNDHEAAVARVEALERENARLEAENAKLRTPQRADLAVRRTVTGSALLIVVVVMTVVTALAKAC